jgi:hypothetical protein
VPSGAGPEHLVGGEVEQLARLDLPRVLEQMRRADHVVVDEGHRVCNRPINMRRCGHVEDGIHLADLGSELAGDGCLEVVEDPAAPAPVLLPAGDLGQPVQIPRAVEAVEEHQRVVAIAQQVLGNVRADESGASGEQDHHVMSAFTS